MIKHIGWLLLVDQLLFLMDLLHLRLLFWGGRISAQNRNITFVIMHCGLPFPRGRPPRGIGFFRTKTL